MFEPNPKKDLERFFKRFRGQQLDGWGLEKLKRYAGEPDDKFRVRLVEFHLSIGSAVKSGHLEFAPEHRPPFDFANAEKFRKKMVFIFSVSVLMNAAAIVWFSQDTGFLKTPALWFYTAFAIGGGFGVYTSSVSA